jgi:hypothetical protein
MLQRAHCFTKASVAVAIAHILLAAGICIVAQQPKSIGFESSGNPILSTGSFYSADPSPIVVGNTLYILAGRDTAPPEINDFVMPEWELFSTKDVSSRQWKFYPGFLKPEQVFAWAMPGRAYAGQIVRGSDKRFYLYAPVEEANSKNHDPFAIGVAVADSILGPWKDAHPRGPIISQSVPEANDIQNIDPTVLVDHDGRVVLYWGTFGRLRGLELAHDMVTPKGHEFAVTSLTGFFEASRIFRRKNTYFLLYADNQAGPRSPCTQAVYHACIAYGTAPSPLGPWTYRGVILDVVSSTTSHPGVAEFKGKWYLAYHTADAKDGGHFRRSIAIDRMNWDDSVSPARILKVQATHEPHPAPPPTSLCLLSIGSRRSATASCAPTLCHPTCGVAGRHTIRPDNGSNTHGPYRSPSAHRVSSSGQTILLARTKALRPPQPGIWNTGRTVCGAPSQATPPIPPRRILLPTSASTPSPPNVSVQSLTHPARTADTLPLPSRSGRH